MLQELLLFLTALLSGITLRALYSGAALLAGSTRLAAMRYALDVLWCAAAFSAFAAFTLFLCAGVFLPFVLLGILGGLVVGELILGFAGKKIRVVG
ncbi:MAG: hypothetical protein FWD58_09340 [Firmicutes bacterium]|nr:hypothetical protein [Bacillota bacterium]